MRKLTAYNFLTLNGFFKGPNGVPVFKNIKQKLDLRLTGSKVFNSGVVLLNYQPTKQENNL